MVIFDWDGTISDSISVIAASIMAACEKAGFPPPPPERARHIIGLGLKESFEYLCPGMEFERFKKTALHYRDEFLEREKSIQLFPGMVDFLADLHARNVILAVATGKSRSGMNRALLASGTSAIFHYTRCADESMAKPDPAMLWEILSHLRVKADECVMVGDTSFDVEMAHRAGMDAVAVLYGAHGKEILEEQNPEFMAHTPQELFGLIHRLIKN